MSDVPPEVFACPGCGMPVQPGEDYVVALEYEDERGFSLHHMPHDPPSSVERRFHVEHFRRQLGERMFVLVHEASTEP